MADMPFPPSHTGSWLAVLSRRHKQRRANAQAWHDAQVVRRARDRAGLVELIARLPVDDTVTERLPRVTVLPEYQPRDGGCARCRHLRPGHARLDGTPAGCSSAGCGCVRFREGWTVWRMAAMCLAVAVASALVLITVVAWAAVS